MNVSAPVNRCLKCFCTIQMDDVQRLDGWRTKEDVSDGVVLLPIRGTCYGLGGMSIFVD